MDAHRPSAAEKFAHATAPTLFPLLPPEDRRFLRCLGDRYRFTVQQVRQLAEAARDLQMWREEPLRHWWARAENTLKTAGVQRRKGMMQRLTQHMQSLRRQPPSYPRDGLRPPPKAPSRPRPQCDDRAVVGICPVASEDTVCCRLRTIDAVRNCGFGCSYCSIQTFGGADAVLDSRLAEKLAALELDGKRLYHFGTGQSSDALLWENAGGILDALFAFADANPNVVLELKTKSDRVNHLFTRPAPTNVVCSWSLNTPVVIANEEHLTADLDGRLEAARRVADHGIAVGFHFHPLLRYDRWRTDYTLLARRLVGTFAPDEIAFVSMGVLTLIKPAVDAIRRRGGESKVLQADLIAGAKGKWTYPDAVKEDMFGTVHEALKAWHGQVFMYLCMEPRHFWEATFGSCYATNEAFEAALTAAALAVCHRVSPGER